MRLAEPVLSPVSQFYHNSVWIKLMNYFGTYMQPLHFLIYWVNIFIPSEVINKFNPTMQWDYDFRC